MFSIHGLTENQQNTVDKFFDEDIINKIATETQFLCKPPKKITPVNFVKAFVIGCCKKNNTYAEWATQIGLLSNGTTPTRQAIFDRLTAKTVEFSKLLLQHALCSKIERSKDDTLLSSFGKVQLQDSTTLHLPDALVNVFPGNTSNDHQQKAVARIQTIIDVRTMQYTHLELTSFTKNDQSASPVILEYVTNGDLVIRDLGYFGLTTFQKLAQKEVFFLSKVKYGVLFFNLDGTKLNMAGHLKAKKTVDKIVLVGAEHKLKVRLIMIPVPAHIAAERIRKARADGDKRLNHNGEYYERLKYNIFITNVPQTTWTPEQATEVYKIRWQIEIIFKSWKSKLNMKTMLQTIENEIRVKVSIYLMLVFITSFMTKIYVKCVEEIEKKRGKYISIIKLTEFLSNNIKDVLTLDYQHLLTMIECHCTYENRKDRKNMAQLINSKY